MPECGKLTKRKDAAISLLSWFHVRKICSDCSAKETERIEAAAAIAYENSESTLLHKVLKKLDVIEEQLAILTGGTGHEKEGI